MKRPPGFSPFR
nr:bradykinin,Met-Lys [Bos taurus]